MYRPKHSRAPRSQKCRYCSNGRLASKRDGSGTASWSEHGRQRGCKKPSFRRARDASFSCRRRSLYRGGRVANQKRATSAGSAGLVNEVSKGCAQRVHAFVVTAPHCLIEFERYFLCLLQGVGMREDLIDRPRPPLERWSLHLSRANPVR